MRSIVLFTALLAGCSLTEEVGQAVTEVVDAPAERSAAERLGELPATDQVDPVNDEVMVYIATSIPNVSDTQLRALYDLYAAFRADQATLYNRLVRSGAKGGKGGGGGGRGAAKGGGGSGGGRGGAKGGGGRGGGGGSGGARGAGGLAPDQQAELDALETDFLAAGRALLNTEQLAAWDDCAVTVDLGPRPLKPPTASPGLAVGTSAPDFSLSTLDGREVTLSALRGKPVIVEFGSYTCPIFRGHVDDMRSLATQYSKDATFVLVYIEEAHTTDGDQAPGNERLGILYPQPTTMAERQAIARTGINELDVRSTVVVDGMDNAVNTAWSGAPNAGYIVDEKGVIVSRMSTIDPVEIEGWLSGR